MAVRFRGHRLATAIWLNAAAYLLGAAPWPTPADPAQRLGEPIRPIEPPAVMPAEARLGGRLFHDTRLSADDSVSCASCHDLARQGIDHLPRAVGVDGAQGPIRTPTVYNSRYNFVQFWDGRADSLEAQVAGPIHNPKEMATDWQQVEAKLRRDPAMVAQFDALYPDGITAANITDAIAAFERTLVTLDAPFDRWLRGDDQALSEAALEGYRLFKSYGCVACHQGANVGGNMYGQMGTFGDYFAERGGPVDAADLGRANITGRDQDRFLFKVPGLRLAAVSPYFFHDASVTDLHEAIRIMGRYQLGREIPDQDVAKIAVFLHSLVGTPTWPPP